MSRFLLLVSLFAFAAPVAAQEAPPLPADHPPTGAMPAGHPPTGGTPHGGMGADDVRRALQGIEIAQAAPDPSVPPGQIHVRVIDGMGLAVPGASVRLGSMGAGGARDADTAQTDDQGRAVFSGLEAGGSAFRITLDHEGARYGCTPFRLEGERGHRVLIRRLPTADNPNLLLQMLGRMMLEYKKDTVRVTVEAQLTNLGRETFVFPRRDEDNPLGGLFVALPEGFSNFQFQQVMTDQRINEEEGGFRITGSIPPGRVALLWAYELPLRGDTFRVQIANPFRTYQYQVISEASESMRLDVEGFEPAQTHEGGGHRFLQTRTLRQPSDPILETVILEVRGIPAPSELRWVALGVSLFLGLIMLALLFRKGDARYYFESLRQARREELLAEAAALQADHDAGEVGPEFHARRMREITDELAGLLQVDQLKG